MGEILPGLIPLPHCPDVVCELEGQQTRLIDLSRIVTPLVAGAGRGSRSIAQWDILWKGSLASAISNEQWTRLRRAQVLAWNIEDKQCHLCLSIDLSVAQRSFLVAGHWHPRALD